MEVSSGDNYLEAFMPHLKRKRKSGIKPKKKKKKKKRKEICEVCGNTGHARGQCAVNIQKLKYTLNKDELRSVFPV